MQGMEELLSPQHEDLMWDHWLIVWWGTDILQKWGTRSDLAGGLSHKKKWLTAGLEH